MIDLSGCVGITDEVLRALAGACKGLTKIDFSHAEITGDGLEALAEGCKGLEEVNLWTRSPTRGNSYFATCDRPVTCELCVISVNRGMRRMLINC